MEQKLAAKNKHPCFILVRPQMGENIGAAARAMWNFGLERMRVVSHEMVGQIKKLLLWQVGQVDY